MKVWTELDMEPVMEDLGKLIALCRKHHDAASGAAFTRIKHEIQDGAKEFENVTIFGYRVGDLLPLALALREKGVQAEEIEDWSWELRQMEETMQTAMSAELTDAIRAAVHGLAESVWEE